MDLKRNLPAQLLGAGLINGGRRKILDAGSGILHLKFKLRVKPLYAECAGHIGSGDKLTVHDDQIVIGLLG